MRFFDTLLDKWNELEKTTAPMRKKLNIFGRDLNGAFRVIWVNFLRLKRVIIAIPVGIVSATNQYSGFDYFFQFFGFIGKHI
jgi:hypothetical protein